MTTAPPDVPPPDTRAPEILDAPREMPAEPPAPLAVWERRLGHPIPSPAEVGAAAEQGL